MDLLHESKNPKKLSEKSVITQQQCKKCKLNENGGKKLKLWAQNQQQC